MHDQLRRDLPDDAGVPATFPLFVALLVDRFGNPPIAQERDAQERDGSRAQAGIYANSARPEHRRAAAAALDRPAAGRLAEPASLTVPSIPVHSPRRRNRARAAAASAASAKL